MQNHQTKMIRLVVYTFCIQADDFQQKENVIDRGNGEDDVEIVGS